MNVYDKIKTLAKNKNMSISKLCRLAGVNRMSLEKWKHKTPKTLEIYFSLMEVLNADSEFKPGGRRL